MEKLTLNWKFYEQTKWISGLTQIELRGTASFILGADRHVTPNHRQFPSPWSCSWTISRWPLENQVKMSLQQKIYWFWRCRHEHRSLFVPLYPREQKYQMTLDFFFFCFPPKARRNAACRSISTTTLNFYQYFLHNEVFIAKASHKLSWATWAFREMPVNPMEREATLHYSPLISTKVVCVSNFLRFSRMASRLNLNSTFTYEYLWCLHHQRARKAVPSKAVCFERAYMSM